MNDLLLKGVLLDWVKVSEESYLRDIKALYPINKIDFSSPITLFTGENGTGKSTLLQAIAVGCGFNPEGGTRNYSFSTYDIDSELWNAIRIVKGYRKMQWGYFFKAETFFNVATQEEAYADACHPSERYHFVSHGESFLKLFQNNIKPNSLYFLDEPEAALSPQNQLVLLYEIYQATKEGSQFIIATHSPILLGIPDAKIFSFDEGKMHICTYEDTDSYKITELFINNREQILKQLLSE